MAHAMAPEQKQKQTNKKKQREGRDFFQNTQKAKKHTLLGAGREGRETRDFALLRDDDPSA